MQWIIDGVVYDTETAKLLANNKPGLATKRVELYLSKNQRYFKVEDSITLDDIPLSPPITPLSQDGALEVWNGLPEKIVGYKEAFPGVEFEDA